MADDPNHEPVPHDDRLVAMGVFVAAFTGLRAAVEADLEPDGLTGSEFEVLIRLGRAPEVRMRMSVLAGQIMVSNSGLTRVVDRLSDAGLVERVRDAADRRVLHAVLTAKGRDLVDQVLPSHLEVIERTIGVLDPEELTAFLGSLRKIRRASARIHDEAVVRRDPPTEAAG